MQLPPRGNGHKGTFGKLLVVGGSDTMLGAPMLAALAAYRSGCGYVLAALPKVMLPAALSVVPEVVGVVQDNAVAAAEGADALVLGPGLGQRFDVGQLLEVDKPTVLDADGLTSWSKRENWWASLPPKCVLTPHPGEAKSISGGPVPSYDAGRKQWALGHALKWHTTVLLKGERTVIASANGRVAVNDTGDSTLAKAGSGDVLSGVIGTLLAQGVEPFDAAVLGAKAHGRAGELAGQKRTTRGALARDVCDQLPFALQELESQLTPSALAVGP
ncbi:MAG: NAD(P)H-hydrate dehydratase [Planctomycetota bacterium]